MNTKNLILNSMLLGLLLCLNWAYAQEKSKKEIKEEQRLQKEAKVKELMDEKSFVFKVRDAQPMGTRQINLTNDNYQVEYTPNLVDSYLPFFGRGYSIPYGGGNGLIFKGEPFDVKFEKKKKYYLLTCSVRSENDVFTFMLNVYFEGTAYLTVNSNNRSTISYTGEIDSIKKKDKYF